GGMWVPGWGSSMVLIWFLGGVTIFCVGVLGIYLAKVFTETKDRPYTIIRQIYGTESDRWPNSRSLARVTLLGWRTSISGRTVPIRRRRSSWMPRSRLLTRSTIFRSFRLMRPSNDIRPVNTRRLWRSATRR